MLVATSFKLVVKLSKWNGFVIFSPLKLLRIKRATSLSEKKERRNILPDLYFKIMKVPYYFLPLHSIRVNGSYL